jgi:hypothetical protein
MLTRRALIPAGGAILAQALSLGGAARAADDGVIVVPMRLSEGRFWTSVWIDGKGPYTFSLDTGSSVYFLAPKIIREAGLSYAPSLNIRGITGGAHARRDYWAKEVVIGGVLRDRTVTFVANPFPYERTVGLLPIGLLMLQPTEVDFAEGQLRIYQTGGPDLTGYQKLSDGVIRGRALYATVDLDGERYRLQLDTGDPGGVTLSASTVWRRGLWNRFPKWTQADGYGVAEGFKGRAVRMQSLKIGDVTMNSPIVQLIAPETVDNTNQIADGLMGLDALRRLSLFVDAGQNSLWIKPNAVLNWPFRYNRSGLTLKLAGRRLVVVTAAPDTPAAKAGLAAGDLIDPPTGISPPTFVQSLSGEPGVVLHFQAERDGKAFAVRMVLQDLI